uniref:IRS-type PTB domain-containing protein n=1 Tax=Branchiostoma floridae TaxID=7739 RepID=C3XTX3_BRAFL|eukprot:XP_002612338.1 hypothetical protein BRAFLDRAFT_80040 [Branchiostoma floridae]
MDANGYSRPRKWPVEEEARYMFSYPRPPSQASTRTTIDMKGYVPMARLPRYPGALDDRHSSKKESYMTGASEFGTFRSIGSNTQGQSRPVSDIGYVEMKSEEPEYINVPNVKYNKGEGVHGAASMDYHIPVPRVLGQAKNVFEHHVYVNVPPRSRLTSGGIECSPGSCSSGVSHMSGCSPEFVSHSPGVRNVSGCSPEFVSRSLGVSDSESSPGLQSQPPMCDTALLRSTSSQNEEFDSRDMTGAGHLEEEPDSWADYRHVDMEPVVGGRCYHANPRHFDELEEQGYKCIVCVNQTNASRAFGMCGTYELKVDMVTPAIILTPREGSTTSITWPLHYIRRYGTDGNGIFRVEAGRRCYPGPGIFNFRVLSGNSQDILDKVELASEMHLNLSD